MIEREATIVNQEGLHARPAARIVRLANNFAADIELAKDGLAVNGSARVVGWFSGVIRLLQTGLVNTYAFLMLFGVLTGMSWVVWRFWHG